VQASGNHQVQYQPNVVVETDANALPKPAQLDDRFPFNVSQRWERCSQEKWARYTHTIETLAENTFLERFDVHNNVGQFGHARKTLT